jgi:nitric oxide dioxygenase
MTSEQVALVQSSFKSVVPIASKAADLFCGRLFEIAPLRAWIKWSATQAR